VFGALAIALLGGCTGQLVAASAAPEPPTALSPLRTPTQPPTPTPSPKTTPTPTRETQSIPTEQPAPEPDADLIAQGIQVYRSQYCGICHTLTAASTRGTFGPNHDHVAAQALDHLANPRYNGSATSVPEYLMESLITPQLYLVPGYETSPHPMPPFGHLSQDDLAALVALLSVQE